MASSQRLNGMPVTFARRVPWLPHDDGMVKSLVASRAEVGTEGGGKFNALAVGPYAFVWERVQAPNVLWGGDGAGSFRAIVIDEVVGGSAEHPRSLVAARQEFLMDPDARFTMAATRTVDGARGQAPRMLVTVEIRRGIHEVLQTTIEGHELLRMVQTLSALVLWGGK